MCILFKIVLYFLLLHSHVEVNCFDTFETCEIDLIKNKKIIGNFLLFNKDFHTVDEENGKNNIINICQYIKGNCTEDSDNLLCKYLSNKVINVTVNGLSLTVRDESNCKLEVLFNCDEKKTVKVIEYKLCDVKINLPYVYCGCLYPIINTNRYISLYEYSNYVKVNDFKIRLCTPAFNGVVSKKVVSVEENGQKFSETYVNVEYTDKNGLLLRFKKNKKQRYSIYFNCHTGLGKPGQRYIQYLYQTTFFEFDAVEACISVTSNNLPSFCEANREVTYSLIGLENKEGNYEIEIPNSELKLLINICSPLYFVPELLECQRSTSFACITNGFDYSRNLGSKIDKLTITDGDEQILALEYTGAHVCSNNTVSSVTVLFECSYEESGPFLEKETEENCKYLIRWRTYSACGRAISTETNDCTIRDNFFGLYKLDLTPLHSQVKDYELKLDNEDIIRFNICGKLVFPCDGNNNASFCLSSKNTERIIGFPANNTLRLEDGSLEMILHGTECLSDPYLPYSVHLYFICDKASDRNIPEIKYLQNGRCEFYLFLKTIYACPKSQSVQSLNSVFDCTVTNDNVTLDLAPLTRHFDNYEVLTEIDNSSIKIIFNVCGNIVYNYGSACSVDFPICVYNMSEPSIRKRYKVFRNIVRSLSFNKSIDSIQMTYFNENIYNLDNVKTIITFQCDKKSEKPEVLLESFNDRTYYIVLRTKYVCDISREKQECDSNLELNEGSNLLHIISNNNKYEVTIKEDKFFVNVCSFKTIRNINNCSSSSYICAISNGSTPEKQDLGYFVSNFEIGTNGVFTLHYLNGSNCKNKLKKSSTIDFLCKPDAGRGFPVFIQTQNDCLYLFEWKTSAVCGNIEADYNSSDFSLINPQLNRVFYLGEIFAELNVAFDKYEDRIFKLSIASNSTEVFVVYSNATVELRGSIFKQGCPSSMVSTTLEMVCNETINAGAVWVKMKPSITFDQKFYSKDTKKALVKYNENKLTFDIRDLLQQTFSPLSSIRFISTGQPVFIKKLVECPKPKDNNFDPCAKDSWQLRDQLEEKKKPEGKAKSAAGKDSSVRPRRCDGVWVPKVLDEYELKEKEKLEKEKKEKALQSGTGRQIRILSPGCDAPKEITCPHAFEMECICTKVLTPLPSFSECIDTVSPGQKCNECGPLKLKACFKPPPEPTTCSTLKKQYKAKLVKERPVPPLKPYDERAECKTTSFCEEPPIRADDVNPIEFKALPCILPIQMKNRGKKSQKRNYSTFAVSRRFMSTAVNFCAEDTGNSSSIPMPKRQYDPVSKEVPWEKRKECANREEYCESKEAPVRADEEMKKKGVAKVKPLPNIFKTPQSRQYSTAVNYPRMECDKVGV